MKDLDEIKALHKEWFPLNYPDDWYAKCLKKKDMITLGIFIQVELNKDAEEQNNKVEVMLGSIISRVRVGKSDACEVFSIHTG